MHRHPRRQSWTAPIELPAAERPVRSRRRLLVSSSITAALLAVVLIVVGLVGVDARPALALCTGDGCVDTTPTAKPVVTVVPLSEPGDASFTVRNEGSSAQARIGVLGYLTADSATAGALVKAGDDAATDVVVATGERRSVTLSGAPAEARAVLVQVRAGNAPAASGARVTFAAQSGGVSRTELAQALSAWSARVSAAMPSREVVARIAAQVAEDLPVPARLTAHLVPKQRSVQVEWTLDAGTEDVETVRVVRVGEAADGSKTAQVDVATTEDGTVLKGLQPDSAYTISVSPVIDGDASASVVLATTTTKSSDAAKKPTPTVSPSASASPAAATGEAPAAGPAVSGNGGVPAAPAGWSPLYEQTFDKDAAEGSFDSVYPGYSAYNGGLDSSRAAGRPDHLAGLWNNTSTSSVRNGAYDCRLHTSGNRPQVCALTPNPSTKYTGDDPYGQLYGRYTVRFKADRIPGYKIAYLLWPTSDRWADGEIDFPEGSLDGTISGSVHNSQGNPSSNAYWVDTKKDMSSWRTATIEWKPGRISFILDDQVWTTTDRSGMPRGPMRWALQAETEIEKQGPSPATEGHIYIDWLAAYKYTGS